jgi:hypothetical protein
MAALRCCVVEGMFIVLALGVDHHPWLEAPSARAVHRFNVHRCTLTVLETAVASDVGLVRLVRRQGSWYVVAW